MKKTRPATLTKVLAVILIALAMLVMVVCNGCTSRTAQRIKRNKTNTVLAYNDTLVVSKRVGKTLIGKDTVPVFNTHGVRTGVLILLKRTRLKNVTKRLPGNIIIADTLSVTILEDHVNWDIK